MNTKNLTEPTMGRSTAHQIYDLLERHVGASPHQRDEFVFHQTREEHWPSEWRFSGDLAFGGKFWRNDGRWYVTCYPEDRNEQRDTIISAANAELAQLHAKLTTT